MEKTEAQIEKEKQAVAAMANAKSNMTIALDRIKSLENALFRASNAISALRYHVGEHSKIERASNSAVYVREFISDEVGAIAKVLP
jgi:hypothetical protein